jgi:hypothetical protein
MMDNLQWTDYGKYKEADLEDYLDDGVIDRFEYITCSIRKYKTVYTIAAIIDTGKGTVFDLYDKDELGFYADVGNEFYKLAECRIHEMNIHKFREMIKSVNRRLLEI